MNRPSRRKQSYADNNSCYNLDNLKLPAKSTTDQLLGEILSTMYQDWLGDTETSSDESNNKSDWLLVAMTLDRLFFLCFIMLMLALAVTLFWEHF